MKKTDIIGFTALKTPEVSKTLKEYWICEKDGRKWLRSASLSKHTSKPYKEKPFLERLSDAFRKRFG